eukprot:g4657.t1
MSYTGCMDEKLRRHGQGSYTYSNTFFKYTGEWRRGVKQGQGRLEMRDGSFIDATFVGGEITGTGTRRWPTGKVYEGDFEDGEFHGQGSMSLPSGEKYIGGFVHNRRHGDGELTLADGTVFQGRFEMHKKNGEGTEYLPGGTVFTGTWVSGLREGPGKLTYAGGETLQGTWRGGMLDPDEEAAFSDPSCGFQYDGGWAVVDSRVAPTGMASGNITPKGTGIEPTNPEDEVVGDSADPSAQDPLPLHAWTVNLGAGDRLSDWVFSVSPATADVALAEKGRILQVTTWLIRDAPLPDGDASPEASKDNGASIDDQEKEHPRAVDILSPVNVEESGDGDGGAEEAALSSLHGGSELQESGSFTLPIGEDGTVALPAMEVMESAAAGIYEMRVKDTTMLSPGSLDIGFEQLPELRIRLSVGVGGGSSSKGKKKKKKR